MENVSDDWIIMEVKNIIMEVKNVCFIMEVKNIIIILMEERIRQRSLFPSVQL